MHWFLISSVRSQINETVTIRLLSAGPEGTKSVLGNLTELNVTILANDDPHGIIIFRNTSLTIGIGYLFHNIHFLIIYRVYHNCL